MKALLLAASLCLVQGGATGLVIAAVLTLPVSTPTKVVIGAGLLMGFFAVWRLGIALNHLRKIEMWNRTILTSAEMDRAASNGSYETAVERVMREMKEERLDAKRDGQDSVTTAYRWCVAFVAVVSWAFFMFEFS